jgi:membrane fusion protein, copper/silver efflux system
MKDQNFLSVLVISIAGCLLFFVSFIFPMPVLAQDHAGHTAQTMVAVEKQKAAKPQATQEAVTEETPQVEISSQQQQLIGVKTVKVSLKSIQKVIRTVGRIEADERKQTTINTKIEGWIEKLHIDYTGRYVKKGEPLVEIYSPELLATQQEFLEVLKWAKQSADNKKDDTLSLMLAKDADAALNAARQRLRLWDISDAQIKQIEQTGKPFRTLTLYSPVSGFVTQKMAVQGMKVKIGRAHV